MTGYESKKAMAQYKITDEQGRPMIYWGGKAQPEQEPVAWLEPEWGEKICPGVGYEVTMTDDHPRDLGWTPLYPHPPQPAQEPVHSVQSNGRHSPLLTHMMNKRTVSTQPVQEPVAGTKTWFEDGKVVTQYLTAKDIYKEPAQEPAIGDIRALKHRIHELEGEVIGYKRILDAQPAQEPVAWMYQHPNNHRKTCYQTYKPSGECTPLYTTPPQRPWVGLTDEEIKAVNAQVSQIPPIDYTTTTYAKAIESKLKEKNNGT